MSEKESLIRGSEESDRPSGRYQALSPFTPAAHSISTVTPRQARPVASSDQKVGMELSMLGRRRSTCQKRPCASCCFVTSAVLMVPFLIKHVQDTLYYAPYRLTVISPISREARQRRSHHLPFTTNITTTTTTTTTSMTQQQHHGTDIESGGGQTSAQSSSPSPSSTSLPHTPPPSSCRQRILGVLRSNLLVFLLILALILGILLSMLLRQRPEPYSERELMYLKYPGELLMNMLKLLILPLIVSSLISGLTSLDTRSSGKLGFRAVVYYMTTTLMAVVLGIVMVLSIQPGKRGDQPKGDGTFRKLEPVDTFLDLLRQMFPDNIIEATFQKALTSLEENPVETGHVNTTHSATGSVTTRNSTSETVLVPILKDVKGINMLGLVVFSIALGIAINHVGPKAQPLKGLFDAMAEVTLSLVKVVIWYSPFGVLFLVAEEVVSMKDPGKTFEQLSFYCITVIVGLTVHGFVTLPCLYFFICRRNPFKFIYGVLQAIVTALGTSSSSATLPVTMRNLEENNGVDPRVTGFVAPVGATINMDGTALYEAVAVIFIGQVEGFELDIGTVIIVCLTSTAAAIGAAGVPQSGLVTMVIVLTAVGFPVDRVGLILAIDWMLDRFRTAVNVLGDAFGAGIVYHLSRSDLARMDEEDKEAARAAAVVVVTESEDEELHGGSTIGTAENCKAVSDCHQAHFGETLLEEDKAHINVGFDHKM